MRAIALAVFTTAPLFAHVMSMSTGEITVQGKQAHYELHMPLYEIADLKSPEAALFGNVRFATGGQPGGMISRSCEADAISGNMICTAEIQFPAPVDRLEVECTFHKITVANHVHLLRAVKDGKSEQAMFDLSSSKAEIRFDPPTAFETAAAETKAGFVRAIGGLAQILFLATLALAGRSRRELGALAGMFLAGQAAAAIVVPMTAWDPAPRFVEAAAALTVAYMAIEILALPEAGKRWLIAGALGGFHGLYFALFLRTTGYHSAFVLAGAALSELILIALFGFVFSRIARVASAMQPARVAAGLLLGTGMFWFVLRMRN